MSTILTQTNIIMLIIQEVEQSSQWLNSGQIDIISMESFSSNFADASLGDTQCDVAIFTG